MSDQWVECIPNFSEGRDENIINEIREAVASVSGVHVLDTSSDFDHNRTVITWIAPPECIVKAAFRGIEMAARHIDLSRHQGVHPRIGAADVVPLVPLRGVSMVECVTLAHELGQRVGKELQIPVYFYEQAAITPKRQNLAEVRRHPYEKLKSTIEYDPSRRPDTGPSRLGPAGAVAIGARGPLIAFNAFLDTDDVSVAKAIAAQVRTTGGGPPFLKALGFLVKGKAQVSMNVIDYRQTTLYTILEAVRGLATQYGTCVTHTELVGLVPRGALVDAGLAYLGLPEGVRDLVLESRIGQTTGDFSDLQFE